MPPLLLHFWNCSCSVLRHLLMCWIKGWHERSSYLWFTCSSQCCNNLQDILVSCNCCLMGEDLYIGQNIVCENDVQYYCTERWKFYGIKPFRGRICCALSYYYTPTSCFLTCLSFNLWKSSSVLFICHCNSHSSLKSNFLKLCS